MRSSTQMRATSVYSVDCICGHHIETETTTLTCPECHRLVVIEWPAKTEENGSPERITFFHEP